MNTQNSQVTKFASLAALLLLTAGNAYSQKLAILDQSEFPTIVRQPEDQAIYVGSSATFSVKAENGDTYQWLRNGVVIEGETNSSLTIEKVAIDDVGYYTCYVGKDLEEVPTRSALLNVMVKAGGVGGMALMGGGGPITVFGAPLFGGGSSGTCPGPYAGYVCYIKTSGWGWAPSGTVHTATDGNRTDTKVEYVGRYGDQGCNQTTITVPHPTFSQKYRFAIYFTNNVPTNAYAITLDGFNP